MLPTFKNHPLHHASWAVNPPGIWYLGRVCLCLRITVLSVGMHDGRQGLSTHIRPRAPLIPIIHKFSQRDLYPPSALQCLLSLPPTSLWLLGRNEMSQCIRTQIHSHVWWWRQPSVSSTHHSLASITCFSMFYLLCASFVCFWCLY